MAIQRLPIQDFLQQAQQHLILDVRSPGEYHHAHVPGACNLPLFSDEERKVVGTTYKQQSREQAIKIGLEYFGPKMRRMVEEVEKLQAAGKVNGQSQERRSSVLLYCWRGGMRSAAVAWLLDLYGFKVGVLSGGYKTFRNEVLQTFDRPFQFRIIGGYTGSGKTDVIKQLEKMGEPVIDLEGLAAHKGSAFGNLKMPPQPSQEMFENLLATQLWLKEFHILSKSITFHSSRTIWLEDESQRIGNVNIPAGIWHNMRASSIVFLEIAFEKRLEFIERDYGTCATGELMEAVVRITKRLGGVETKNTLEFLQQGNKKEAFRILLHYYDKLYLKALHNRENLPALITNVPCTSVQPENANILFKNQTV